MTELRQRTRGAIAEARCYWSASATTVDFVRLVRTRLSYSRLARFIPRPFEAVMNLHGLGGAVHLRSHTTDVAVLRELLVDRSYEHAANATGGVAHLIVDLGANTGLASRWFLSRNPQARAICVEPDPSNALELRRNLAGTSFDLHQGCIAARSGPVGLVRTPYGALGYRMIALDDAPAGSLECAALTMDEILGAGSVDRIDLLKCDIEGTERELFEDCRSWIHRVDTAVVECHWGFTAEDLMKQVRRNGGDFIVLHHEQSVAPGCELVTLRNRSAAGGW